MCSLQASCLAKENASERGKPLLITDCESMSSLASLNRVSFLHHGKCSCNILMKVTADYINSIDFDTLLRKREKGRGTGEERHTQREWWRRLWVFQILTEMENTKTGPGRHLSWCCTNEILKIKGRMIQETQWIWSQKWLKLGTWSVTDYSSAQVVTDKASGFPAGTREKEAARQCRRLKRCRFDPWVGKIPWRHAVATHSSILAWRTPWTEEPGRLQSMGSQRVGHDWGDLAQNTGKKKKKKKKWTMRRKVKWKRAAIFPSLSITENLTRWYYWG